MSAIKLAEAGAKVIVIEIRRLEIHRLQINRLEKELDNVETRKL